MPGQESEMAFGERSPGVAFEVFLKIRRLGSVIECDRDL